MALPNYYKKTRIAPTPSGFLHLGNILSFSITAALAQKTGAKILLRIDDLDRARVNRKYIQDIFDTLNFLEIPWDEGPKDVKAFEDSSSQTLRINLYQQALAQLAEKKMVFACTCSRSQLSTTEQCRCQDKQVPLSAPNSSWRLITRNGPDLTVKKYNGAHTQAALPAGMRNFVVKKKDGFPAYQLTSVIDDLFYGVDLVIRGEDLWPSTLAQQELANALRNAQFNSIAFYHHPLLAGPSGGKLSKSAGATSVKYLRESGKSRAEVFALIGSMLGINEETDSWQRLGAVMATD
jgi:glutamyl-tRNA synthetase